MCIYIFLTHVPWYEFAHTISLKSTDHRGGRREHGLSFRKSAFWKTLRQSWYRRQSVETLHSCLRLSTREKERERRERKREKRNSARGRTQEMIARARGERQRERQRQRERERERERGGGVLARVRRERSRRERERTWRDRVLDRRRKQSVATICCVAVSLPGMLQIMCCSKTKH